MDTTKSYIKIYNITPETAEDFEFDYSIEDSDLLTELVPNLSQWGDVGWVELEEYEYDIKEQIINLVIDTKWEPPVRWLQQASQDTVYFENKLITMTPSRKTKPAQRGWLLWMARSFKINKFGTSPVILLQNITMTTKVTMISMSLITKYGIRSPSF